MFSGARVAIWVRQALTVVEVILSDENILVTSLLHGVAMGLGLFNRLYEVCLHTVKTLIVGLHARTLELPLLVRPGSFFFLFCLKLGLKGSAFALRSSLLSLGLAKRWKI